jgi:hypothetical protein
MVRPRSASGRTILNGIAARLGRSSHTIAEVDPDLARTFKGEYGFLRMLPVRDAFSIGVGTVAVVEVTKAWSSSIVST